MEALERIVGRSVSAGQRGRMSDEELVFLVRRGDYTAFETLYERHRTTVYRFVYQMVPRRDDAEDIVQEAFVRAYQNIDRYRDQARFTTWLLRISANLSTDFCRTMSRRQSLEQKEANAALDWMTIGKVEDPIYNLEQDRTHLALRAAIMALPSNHRIAFVLRDVESKGYSEIAEILGCSVGGAKLRVLRARRALRTKLVPLIGDDHDV